MSKDVCVCACVYMGVDVYGCTQCVPITAMNFQLLLLYFYYYYDLDCCVFDVQCCKGNLKAPKNLT